MDNDSIVMDAPYISTEIEFEAFEDKLKKHSVGLFNKTQLKEIVNDLSGGELRLSTNAIVELEMNVKVILVKAIELSRQTKKIMINDRTIRILR